MKTIPAILTPTPIPAFALVSRLWLCGAGDEDEEEDVGGEIDIDGIVLVVLAVRIGPPGSRVVLLLLVTATEAVDV